MKKRLFILIFAALLSLSSLSACETERDLTDEASAEISLNDGIYIMDGKFALSQALEAYWEENGSSAAVTVDIEPYSVYDLSPTLDGTRYNGLTYQEQKEKLDNAAIQATLLEIQYKSESTEENEKKLRDAEEVVLQEQTKLDAIPQMQNEQKLKSVVDRLTAEGIQANISNGGITATLSRDELMTLAETSCIFFTVSIGGLEENQSQS